ncbi:dethiobiotin synthase [Fodinibius halophilus]|uniref:ATP-dependent dethiobiotin synthetase BioD n=1 Tax=Fodinibius halophilus TaxID=1736908 RepID=A0A6M1T2Z2_9BACT|nr:dethiobiotin synthase [Fodinibius halophilus]NGP86983.1 dethiobiotin synthase [Fodinibius halophilus]
MYKNEWPSEIFVSGTDTEIGKTVVSAILTKGLEASYWKPIQAGLEEETDTQFVQRTTDFSDEYIIPERYRLETPMSPHGAAEIDDVYIEMSDFEMPEYETDHLIVEGAGGLLVPFNDDKMIIDLIERLGIPVLLTARSTLGTLNHTFLSLEALRSRDIPILGVVLNGPQHQSNREAIQHYGDINIIAEIDTLESLNADTLKKTFDEQFCL